MSDQPGNPTDADNAKAASQILRALVTAAKKASLYVLGIEMDDGHTDLVCILLGENDDAQYLVPVARLLRQEEVDKLKQLFGDDYMDDSNAGHA